MKRSPHRVPTKPKSCAVIVYFPDKLIRLLDKATLKTKRDRSKFIRAAVEEKLKLTSS